jgi:imidazolonepropionase-like amidohydrolase
MAVLPAAGVTAEPKAFVGARILDGTGGPALGSATMLIRDGRIVAIGPSSMPLPPGVERIDATGRTIIPGLINTHGHVGETRGLRSGPELYDEDNVRRQLGLYARYGITTVYSLGGDQAAGFKVRDEQAKGSLDTARLYVAGPVISAPSPDEARKQVREVAATKPDIIKIRVDDNLGTVPKMAPEVYGAVIDEAHKQGLRVAAHIFYLDDAKGVLRAGADYIAHSVRDQHVDLELVSMLLRKDVCLCPTLMREVSTFVYETEPSFFSDPFFLRDAERAVLDELREPKRQEGYRTSASAQSYKKALGIANANLKFLQAQGVTIAFGTDTGPPARFQGYFEHLELERMVQAGLTPAQVLVSATRDAAKCMKLDGLGTLVPGAWADFIVLTANPLEDIRNTRTIDSVWIAGNRIVR